MKEIIEVSGSHLSYLAYMASEAEKAGKTLKFAVDGGLKFKAGEGMWTPPMGHPVDGNGNRIG